MSTTVRCAVIGVGNMGQHHARGYAQLAHLTAVCDADLDRANHIASLYGARSYTSVSELLRHEQLDAISVAVPSKYHRQVAEQTLKAGIPTLIEKPIATTVEDGTFLVRLAKKQHTALMVGHIERFNPAVQALKKQLEKGALGEIVTITAIRSGINPPREKMSHVGLDLTIHDLDVCLYLLEEQPRHMTVYTQRVNSDQAADSVSALVTFPKTIASFSTNWISPVKVRQLTLTGTKGYAELNYVKQTLRIYNKPPVIKNATYRELQQLVNVTPKKVYVPRHEPLKQELKFFLNHRSQPEVLTSLTRDALTALKIVLQ